MVEKNAQVEQEVMAFLETYNAPNLFGRRRKLEETDLNDDMRMDPLDAHDLMTEYAEKFGIEPATVTFGAYFPEDFSDDHLPLTVGLLIVSAQAGRWLGE